MTGSVLFAVSAPSCGPRPRLAPSIRTAGSSRAVASKARGDPALLGLAGGLLAAGSVVRRCRGKARRPRLLAAPRRAGSSPAFFDLQGSLRGAPRGRGPGRPRGRTAVKEANTVVEDGRSYFQMGADTLRVPFSMHQRHRERLLARLRPELGTEDGHCCVLLEGGGELPVYDTDTVWDFKQESNFQWLFGVREPGCFGALDVASGEALLFVPRLPEEYEAWMGPRRTTDWFRETYEVDKVFFVDEMPQVLEKELQAEKLLVYHGKNRDSGLRLREPRFAGSKSFEFLRDGRLWDALAECRVLKDEDEIAILQFVNDVSSDAHVAVMRGLRPGVPEYAAEADFRHYAFLRGCARVGYHCICPSGSRCAVLHYGHAAFPNAEEVLPGEMKLHDMGAEYHCYTADITCTFPVDGRFTEPQRTVYEAVWEATLAVERSLRPGVSYREMHLLSERTLLDYMVQAGLFVGPVEEMLERHLMSHFMPHGLGHSLGLDVHDVGGYPPGEQRQDDPRVEQNLRCGRALLEGMVITVEPGFYFVDYLIERALSDPDKARFIVSERLEELRPVGGVRIEDDVLVTDKGCRVLTRVPRTVEEVEAVMAGGAWEARERPFREYHASDSESAADFLLKGQ
uniref:Xaa-Pro dipeptidase n=1 Tax=Alexandrium monilatum TaxID=311494 RepID=A0A7S4V2M7_9DINO